MAILIDCDEKYEKTPIVNEIEKIIQSTLNYGFTDQLASIQSNIQIQQ